MVLEVAQTVAGVIVAAGVVLIGDLVAADWPIIRAWWQRRRQRSPHRPLWLEPEE